MRQIYNRFAGESLDRLAGLSDGIFAVAMTLLVLDLRVPASEAITTDQQLWEHGLQPLMIHLVPYIMSFITLGIFWVGQQTQLNKFTHADRDLVWIHLAFLLVVSLMPFSTGLLAEHIQLKLALGVYWLNIFLLGAAIFVSLHYARHKHLFKEEVTTEAFEALNRRVVVAQALYAFGALLCFINTYVSISFIILVQLNYVFAPRINLLYKL